MPATRWRRRLLANGVHLVGRSFKYHRPRGIYSAGAEEPNALVQLARGARTEPNARATTLELYDGLVRREPELLAVGALRRRRASPMRCRALLPAGFYYKTFMWPPTPQWWLRYEHLIRRAAGMGRAAERTRSRSLRAPVRALRRARRSAAASRDCRRRCAAARSRRARHRVRRSRAGSAASVVVAGSAIDARSAQEWADAAVARARRASRTSRCCRARRPSATTTATSSARSSASPTIWRRRLRTCRGSGCG